MLTDIQVTVQAAPSTANTTYDGEGMATPTWTASQTTEWANKQPNPLIVGEIAFQDYGVSDVTISYVYFMKTDTTAAAGGRIVDTEGTYDIIRVEKYPNHYEASVRPVVG